MSNPYFPQIANGIMTQLPFASGLQFRNYTVDMPTAKHFSYSEYSTPLGLWTMNYQNIQSADLAILETFVASVGGMYGQFTLLDPGGNLVPASENYADASWTKLNLLVGGAVPDPFGGTLATLLTANGAPSLRAVVLPAGNASGFTLCASAYVRAVSNTWPIRIGFSDSVAGDQGSAGYTIGTSWQRIQFRLKLTTNGVISVYISGWPDGIQINLFGVQVAPLPGPGAYAKTPGNYGLHVGCFLASDQLKIVLGGYNSYSVSIPIEETF